MTVIDYNKHTNSLAVQIRIAFCKLVAFASSVCHPISVICCGVDTRAD